MSIVISTTREHLLARRGEILQRIALTDEEFVAARNRRSLSGPEWEAKEELDAIDFLLTDAHPLHS